MQSRPYDIQMNGGHISCYSTGGNPAVSPGPLVVVVEDDPASRKSLGRVLRAGGFDAAMFASAEEFLSATIGRSPIAMLLDIQLPTLSGLDLQRRLRREGSTLPFIVITAHDDNRAREDAERLGCLAYLAKPCSSSTILTLLRSLDAPTTQPR